MKPRFPKNAISVVLKRNGKYLVPNGSTVIEADDTLIFLFDTSKGLDKMDECSLRKVMPLDF